MKARQQTATSRWRGSSASGGRSGTRAATAHRVPRTLAVALVVAGLGMLVSTGATSAQGIQATVDRNQVALDEQIQLSVVLEGTQNARPRLPDLPGFQVISRGQSRQMRIVNGEATTSVQYNYFLVPRSTGEFTIGAVEVEIDGQTYRSRPFKVRVTDAPEPQERSSDFFIVARVSDETPFVGEQVLYTWRFHYRVPIADARLQVLQFGELLVEDLGDVREYTTTLNGVEYRVSEIRKALFAQRDGSFTIPPSELAISVPERGSRRRSLIDDFFSRGQVQTRMVRSAPIELRVRPLPPAPADFSGLVGEFGLDASLSKSELSVGDSATLELTVRGTGNAQQIASPRLPELEAFKIYDDAPSSSLDRSGGRLSGRKVFRKALVPMQAGELEVPPIELSYFDPEREEFVRARTDSIALDVAPSEGEEDLMLTESLSPSRGKTGVRILADDILPIHRSLDSLGSDRLQGWRAVLWASGFWLPPIGFALLLWQRRRRLRYLHDAGLRRREEALRTARSALTELQRDENGALDDADTCRRASRALRTYVGDKTGTEGPALTPIEVEGLLRDAGLDGPTARRFRETLDRLEAAQYGGAAVGLPSVSGLLDLLEAAERASTRSGEGTR